ncbi:ADP-ribosyl cyclase/cyclic ADP-ribose hydrolase 2 isoform X1 [Phascolarctos cinereus]|uniref:ADP-ribosyl cyclase/cyclic ADP-ribose hydrolase n=1 Tax=Phascolarctos cinereus TaxID=38626 RepID=A0A6P5KS81_PHACI|nr:ADP-ribosyl cyclase/cyclic ADP-ribose hydrolase 2 isoform X1 [Phascolarctos cinereus]XP_020848600.1 ADP-ribosyl cyclase/cyclic ADP-ribose hydrolase 2 isoform X1 [Phascolarctos cinereus]
MESSNLVLQGLMLFLLLFLMGQANVYTRAGKKRWSGEGTSPHLESIFLGRCNEYISVVNPELSEKNCSAIWEAFESVLHKDPCSVLPSDYDLFINLSRHSIPRDKSLFWENNYYLVIAYADNARRLMPITDVLYGRVGDVINWCRQENGSDFDYHSCPTVEDCENNAVDSFWKRASSQYAHDSSGVIHVMLNGSEPSGAYPVEGFFAGYEIPNFQKDKVTQFEIWVMHEIGGPYLESCGEGSVKILERRLKNMEFKYECINDYRPVKLLKCLDYPAHADCIFNSAAESTQQRFPSLFGGKWDPSLMFFLFLTLASEIQL